MKYPEPESERFTVQYIITTNDKRSIEEHASDITLEQTVEVPEDCVPEKHFEDGTSGLLKSINCVTRGGAFWFLLHCRS